jgi:predicted phage-related endonuclease|nr:MAG TPA: Exonuclease [Caudoviricetes sp.]
MADINDIMKELAEYIRMQEEAAAMVESLKDQLKERMTAAGVESLAGSEHKATYKAVTSSRVDTTRLKKDLPEIAARYTKTTTARRFTFA